MADETLKRTSESSLKAFICYMLSQRTASGNLWNCPRAYTNVYTKFASSTRHIANSCGGNFSNGFCSYGIQGDNRGNIYWAYMGEGVTYIDQARVISVFDVVQHRCLIEARQLGHILDFVELWRIHLLYVIAQDHHTLARFGQFHFHFVAMFALNTGGNEALQNRRREEDECKGNRISNFYCKFILSQSCLVLVLLLYCCVSHGKCQLTVNTVKREREKTYSRKAKMQIS